LKENKQEKIAYKKDEIFSSSSDEDDTKKIKKKKKNPKTPKKLKHVYNHKVFQSAESSLPVITEEDQLAPDA
jgi:hypothetical protein